MLPKGGVWPAGHGGLAPPHSPHVQGASTNPPSAHILARNVPEVGEWPITMLVAVPTLVAPLAGTRPGVGTQPCGVWPSSCRAGGCPQAVMRDPDLTQTHVALRRAITNDPNQVMGRESARPINHDHIRSLHFLRLWGFADRCSVGPYTSKPARIPEVRRQPLPLGQEGCEATSLTHRLKQQRY